MFIISLPASVIAAQTGSNFEMSHVLLFFSTVTRTLLAKNSGSGLSQIDASDSVFAHYHALIRLRHESAILVDGDFTPMMAEHPQIWAYTRTTPDRKLLVIANCGRGPRTVEVGPEWIGADLLLGNLPGTSATSTSTSVDLAGWDRASTRPRWRRPGPLKGRRRAAVAFEAGHRRKQGQLHLADGSRRVDVHVPEREFPNLDPRSNAVCLTAAKVDIDSHRSTRTGTLCQPVTFVMATRFNPSC